MIEQTKQYVHSVLDPICKAGFDIFEERTDIGTTLIINPKVYQESRFFEGGWGQMAMALRYLVKSYAKVNFQGSNVNIFIPNPNHKPSNGEN